MKYSTNHQKDFDLDLSRFARQAVLENWGSDAQISLRHGRALIIGVGGLGSWVAELLTRSGLGFLRLVDDDIVELTNIHRQALFCEDAAHARRHKVLAAAERLRLLNRDTEVEAVIDRVDRFNIVQLAKDVQVVVDGTDNFLTRFLINDYCVKNGLPWVFAGVIRTEGQVMAVIPKQTPCLRCLIEPPTLACTDPSCQQVGVLGPVVSAIASLQAMEVLKLIAGKAEAIASFLFKMDMWHNRIQQLGHDGPRMNPPCPCCVLKEYEFLEP